MSGSRRARRFTYDVFPLNIETDNCAPLSNVTLRQAAAADRPFIEATYFETQRGMIEQLFGWGGDAFESAKFDAFYDEASTQIILVDDHEAGFVSLLRNAMNTNVQCLFLRREHQGRGIGTHVLQGIIAQAASDGDRLTIGTEKINPAKRLYERLGFIVIRETKYRIEYAYPSAHLENELHTEDVRLPEIACFDIPIGHVKDDS